MKKTISLILLLLTFSTGLASAAVQYWDTDGSAAGNDPVGPGLGGTGTWDTVANNWWDGLGALGIWIDGNDAVFTGTPGTVTLSGPRSANSLTFRGDGYVITASTLTLTGTAILDVQNGTVTNGSLLAGTVGYTKNGGATLVLTNLNNSITGPVFINNGVLQLLSGGRIGGTAVGSGDVTINGGTLRDDDLTAAGSLLTTNRGIIIGPNGGTFNIPNSAQILLYAGLISGAGNTLTVNGPGEIRMTTNALNATGGHNTFGKLVIDSAMFTLGQSVTGGAEDSLGAVPSVTTDDAITLQNGGRLRGNVFPITLDSKRGITLGAGGGLIRTVNSASTLIIASAIKGANPLTIGGGSDTGIVALSNPANSFGDLIVAAGSLRLDANGVIPDTSTVTVSGGTFALSGATETVGTLILSGGTISGGGTLTGSSYDFRSGTLSSALGGTVDVVKTTTGTVTMNAATYNGNTLINAGKLVTSATTTAPGGYSVAANATLGAKVSSVGAVINISSLTNDTSSTNEFDFAGLGLPTSTVINATNVTVNGVVLINVKGFTNTSGTVTLLQYTTRSGAGSFVLGSLPPSFTGSILDDTVNQRVVLTISGGDTLRWIGNVTANLDINNAANTTWQLLTAGTPTFYQENGLGSDSVQFDDNATGSTTVSIPVAVSPLRLVVTNNSKAYTFSGAGKISGPVTLVKSGSNQLTISTVNDYTGGTILNAGTNRLGSATPFGTGKLTINGGVIKSDSATLRTNSTAVDLNGDVTLGGAGTGALLFQTGAWNILGGPRQITTDTITNTISSVIAGTALTKVGNGTLDLTAANTFVGFTHGAGIVRVNSTTALGAASSSVTLSNGVTLATTTNNTARTLTYAWLVNGNFTLGQAAGGTASLTLAGTMDLNGGIRSITTANTLSNDVISAVITNGGLIKTSAGILDLSGANVFTNGLQHNQGILRINNATALGAVGSPVSLANGVTLSTSAGTARTPNQAWTINGDVFLGQTNGGTATVNLAGTMDLGGAIRTFTLINTNDTISAVITNGGIMVTNLGSTLTISGVNVYSGDTIITNGAAIALNGTSTLGTGTLRLAGGGLAGSANRSTPLSNSVVMTANTLMAINTTGSGNRTFPIGGSFITTGGTLTLRNTGTTNGILNLRFHTPGLNFTRPILLGDPAIPAETGMVQVASFNTSDVADQTFNGVISGYGSFNRGAVTAGTGGRTILTQANLYTGGTTIDDGTLIVNNASGSGTGSGNVTINPRGILSGNGTISGAVLGAGTISAGATVGVLTLGNGLDLGTGGTNLWELNANSTNNPGTDFDQLSLTGGNLALGGSSILRLRFTGASTTPDASNAFWQVTNTWKVISLSGTATNAALSNFSAVDAAGATNAGTFLTSVDGSGNVYLTFTPKVIPPPPTIDPVIVGAGTTNAVISWSSVPGAIYEVQYKNDLNDANWSVLGNVTATGSTASITDTTDPVPAQRFYRIVSH